MAIYEVQGPNGAIYEVDAPSKEDAASALKRAVEGDRWWEEAPIAEGSSVPDRWWEEAPIADDDLSIQQMLDLIQGSSAPDKSLETARPSQDDPSIQEMLDMLALAAAAKKKRVGEQPETSMLEQSMSGVNEGIAGILGAPVDIMTGVINYGSRGVNSLFGTDLPPITDAFGGSGTFEDLLAPTISNVQPQNTAQRYGRRIGQEVGAMSVPGGAMLRNAKAPLALGAMETVSAVGSGVAGQTSQEIAPGNATVDTIASLAGGLSPVAASRALRPSPKAPSVEMLKAEADAAYEEVRNSGATLSPASADALAGRISGTLGERAATRKLNPRAAIAADALSKDLRSAPPTIAEVDQVRQWVGKNVAGSNEAGERAIGVQMKNAIDNHLDTLTPSDVSGTNRAHEVVSTLQGAREKAHRVHKSQLFEAEDTGAIAKGLRRAATTGTGGNEINAIRQNVRRVLENPKLRRGFSESELKAMREIADGTPTQNALRLLGRLAPTSGGLPLGGFAGAAAGVGATGNPLLLAPSVIGQGAKMLGERSTRKAISGLGELIRNGKPLPKKAASDLENNVIAALVAQQMASPAERGNEATNAVVRALLER
ncbi:hypothetical protein [Roseovarius sp. CH_XMU1461]|uniref:hypothetical protein n=1 Tax=Roseovarius sp. CH_XMU1461 TaxID=3107777 RepID=UPI00300A3726